MPDLDPYDQLAVAMREAKANAEKASKVEAALAKRTVSGTDNDKIVTAVASGAGQIIDLSIDESALKYPGRLGRQVTIAIMNARKTAEELAEKAYAKYLPSLPSSTDLKHVEFPIQSVDYHKIDYDGPTEIKNKIAELLEAVQQLGQTRKELDNRYLHQVLSSNMGVVKTNISRTVLKIEIESDAPKQVGLERLADQVLVSISLAEKRALEIQARSIDAININGDSLGRRLREGGAVD